MIPRLGLHFSGFRALARLLYKRSPFRCNSIFLQSAVRFVGNGHFDESPVQRRMEIVGAKRRFVG